VDVPGADEIRGGAFGIDDGLHRAGALVGGDAGFHGSVIDRREERGAQRRRVQLHERRQLQAAADVGEDRHAELAPAVEDEVHRLRRRLLGGADEIPLVLAILGVQNDNHLAPGDGVHSVENRREFR
jgi:hypothetical protein